MTFQKWHKINLKDWRTLEDLYYKYSNLKSRCRYGKNYVTKWIKNEWSSYKEFRKDMWLSYWIHRIKYGKHNTTLDRIDGNNNYSKNNCRWATYAEQNKNRTSTIFFTIFGKKQCIRDWCNELWIPYQQTINRISRGWNIYTALTKSLRKHTKKIN